MYFICSNNTAGYLTTDITFCEAGAKTVKFETLKEALEYLQSMKFYFCYPVLIEEKAKAATAKKTAKKAAKKRKK